MIPKKNIEHRLYYFFILLVLVSGITGVLKSETRQAQSVMVVLTIFSYIILGIFHHLTNHNFTIKIVVEYVLIGVLGLSVFYFLLGSIL